MSIKKGSVVRCIDDSKQSRPFLEVGKLYTVRQVGGSHAIFLYLEEDKFADSPVWLASRFKLANIEDKISLRSKYRMIRIQKV